MFKIFIFVLSFCIYSNAVVFEDMFNEKTQIKDDIQKIYASSPILLYSLYAVDKTKIAGLNFSCGGVTIYISGTPAIFAGNTFIKTLEG